MTLRELLHANVCSIVDDEASVEVVEQESDNGLLLEVRVGKDDVGKVIGKKGRIANSIRTLMKAAGAKRSTRVMVNVFNTPSGTEESE
jgi:predicted RNA-binding protein YlqC (UPF0109 family)